MQVLYKSSFKEGKPPKRLYRLVSFLRNLARTSKNGEDMGRIKTALVKRVTNELFEHHRERFKTDYSENKKIVSELVDIPSKKIKNIIAGYITRLVRRAA